MSIEVVDMRPDAAFLVLDITPMYEWVERFGPHRLIPPAKRPTVLHTRRDSAEQEALRLCQATGHQFVVFEAVQMAVTVKAPTHVTLGGHVFQTEQHAVLAELGDGIPF